MLQNFTIKFELCRIDYKINLMKYKKLTEEQIVISLDRLTRFKNTKEKYLRVFFDIILSCLMEPKIKKSDLGSWKFSEIKNCAQEIFNNSLIRRAEPNLSINKTLKDYENSVFKNDESVQELLNNEIDYNSALNYIKKDSVVNLRWLKSISLSKGDLRALRERYQLKYPVEKVILVEGLTEEILLPAFSKFLGFDFYTKGIQIIPAGGKNQVVKMYYKLIEELKIPIFLLLDKDAEDNIAQIKPRLRQEDQIHLVSCGEFEDLLPKSLIVKSVNSCLQNFAKIEEEELDDKQSKVYNLENIFKTKGLHEFKKAEFAKLVRMNISQSSDISSEIKDIINEIAANNKPLDTRICS